MGNSTDKEKKKLPDQRLPLGRITCKMILTVLTKEEVEMMEKTEERIFDHKKLERCCTKRSPYLCNHQ